MVEYETIEEKEESGPIKISLVVEGSDVSMKAINEFTSHLKARAAESQLIIGDVQTLRVVEENNTIVTIPTAKSSVNDQVISIIKDVSDDHLFTKDIWILCDDVEDHPEILKS